MKHLILLLALIGLAFPADMNAQITMNDFDNLFKNSAREDGGDRGGSGGSGGGGSAGGAGSTDGPGMGGGGLNESVIPTNLPGSGTLVKKRTLVTWDNVGIAPYQVTIKLGRKVLLDESTSLNKLVMDFNSLDLEADTDYSISIVDSGDFKTNDIEVQFADETELSESMETLMADEAYQNAKGVEKELRKAVFLETEGWMLEADRAYNIITDDVMDMRRVVNMYKAFKARN